MGISRMNKQNQGVFKSSGAGAPVYVVRLVRGKAERNGEKKGGRRGGKPRPNGVQVAAGKEEDGGQEGEKEAAKGSRSSRREKRRRGKEGGKRPQDAR